MRQTLYVLVGVLAGFVLAGTLLFISRAPAGTPIVLEPAPTKAPIAVHIKGAVPRPGLYEFPNGARLQDAINAAGGLLASANADAINLARLLQDGEQIDIPYKEGLAPAGGSDTSQEFNNGAADPFAAAAEEESAASAPQNSNAAVELININTASAEELDTLPGIGPSIAQRIVEYRTQNGPFATIDEIINVSGIGPATFEKIKDLITV